MPIVIAVTDLGPGNTGTISAADVPPARRAELIKAVANPEYRKRATNRFRCVDGRTPEGGLQAPEGMADPQEAGGAAVSETAADFMDAEQTFTLSEGVARNTKANVDNGYPVVIHGDDHKGKKGCLANLKMRETLWANAENIEVVAPKAWTVATELGLDRWLTEDDVTEKIVAGKNSADDDKRWDATAEEVVDIALDNGAEYEELVEEHMERLAVVDVSPDAWSEEQFMKDHTNEAGDPIEAFVVSIGAVRDKLMDIARKTGQTERAAASKTLGVLLFNIGLTKQASAEDTPKNPNASLPVVIIG